MLYDSLYASEYKNVSGRYLNLILPTKKAVYLKTNQYFDIRYF